MASDIDLGPQSTVRCRYKRRAAAGGLISFTEVLMLTAQMSQVVLYNGDARRREQTGNMWMRRATFSRRAFATAAAGTVGLALSNRRELHIDGRTIETADVLADDVFGVHVTASLAVGA